MGVSPVMFHLYFFLFLSTAFANWKIRYGRAYSNLFEPPFQDVQLTVYPLELNIREGREAIFDCRARTSDGTLYPEVRWTRSGGPLPPTAHESGGRLTITSASVYDSGKYKCTTTVSGRTYDAYVQLNVQPYGPQEYQNILPTSEVCRADERACANKECIKIDYVCDGEPDCRDRSDEQQCPSLRSCEPNEFKCNNGRCVQKMWLCDGDDDCGDNSDEQTCDHRTPSDGCTASEFQCRDQRQCVPSSFHCDGTNDCQDGSDEIGCVQPTIVEAPETNKQVPPGGTFQLTCKAVAVPEPYINWRLNWGPVCDPPRCVQHSQGGLGTLTVSNAQPLDQGAYTCEAINVKGRVLATPDCIVRIVNLPAPTPHAQLIRCDPAGSVQTGYSHQCHCKQLTMGPTCNECIRGAYHLNEKAPQGCFKCFCFGVTDQCRSSSWYRTRDKLRFTGDSQGITISDMDEKNIKQNPRFEYDIPGMLTYVGSGYETEYWRMPHRFLGNKVTAYGGKMEFELQFSCSGAISSEPLVVIKGNGITLVYRHKDYSGDFISDRPIRIAIDTFEANFEHLDNRPATRENLMMVLADMDAFLIRATHCYGLRSTSIGDVSWEIAVDRDTQDRLALEVEHCSCPPGYIGLSCEDCAPGYERSGQGLYLGTCVPARPRPQCSPAGAVSSQPSFRGICQCKTYAVGPLCDQCPPNSFYMAASNPQGCIPCFCSGVTQRCSSSSYSRAIIEIDYSRGARDQLQITSSDSHNPFIPQSQPVIANGEIIFSQFYEAPRQTLYWKLPAKFLGNKVTSYGGILKYVFRYSGEGSLNTEPDIILRGNDITLFYKNKQPIYPDRENEVEVKLFEDRWQRIDEQAATREHILMALADLDAILIKMTYLDECSSSSIIRVSLEHAEARPTGGPIAYEVEQCVCPPGYVGTSCEDCAPGYSRTGGGLYLGLCERCECHGHATHCDREHGYCVNCQHNTEGDQCERCKPGFIGNARQGTPHDCQPAATRPPCNCNNHSPRGCDSFGRCLLCEHNTEGYNCQQCKRGYYGEATRGTPYDCTPCPCPGTSDCFLDQYGQVQCRNCPASLTGRLCDECAPGYTRSRTHGGRICEPIGRVESTNVIFVPTPEVVGKPPPLMVDPLVQTVNENEPATFRCWVPGLESCELTWHKEYLGGPLPYGVYQSAGVLKIPRAQLKDAGNYICTASNEFGVGQSPPARLIVNRPPQRPRVDPKELTVQVGEPARFRCWVPGVPTAKLVWKMRGERPLPQEVQENEGILNIHRSQMFHAGDYVCTSVDPEGRQPPMDSPPVRLNVQQRRAPLVDPREQTVNENDPARFRCWVPDDPEARLRWSKQSQPLPYGASDDGSGTLYIPKVMLDDGGSYVCSIIDPHGSPVESAPAVLHVKRPFKVDQAPQVDPLEQTVPEGQPSQIKCFVPGDPSAIVSWRKYGGDLPESATQEDGILQIPYTNANDEGYYICSTGGPEDDVVPLDSRPAQIKVKKSGAPQIDPPSQTVNVNDPSYIRCWVPENPHAELIWRKKHGHLSTDASQVEGILTIPQTQESDAGEYICSTRGTDGSAIDSPPARIDINKPKAPQVAPPDQTVNEGSPSQIRCWVPGDPSAVLRWKKRDGTLPIEHEDSRGVLSIRRTFMADSGDYICTATDPDGRNPVDSSPARINVRPEGATPVVDPPEQTVTEGEPVRINCYIHGQRTSDLTWSYRVPGGQLPPGVRTEGDALIIDRSELAHAGDFICTNNAPEGPKHASPARVNVNRRASLPRPIATPVDQTVKSGERASFHCDANSETPARIKWGYKTADGPFRGDIYQSGDDVIINLADASNAGEYICTATNQYGSAEAEPVRLHVTDKEEPPTARVVPRVWNGQPGDRHQFRCITTGFPQPEVTWTAPGGRPLPDDVYDVGGGVLDFSNGRSELNGDYTCTATNIVGEASDHGSVNIGPSLTVRTTPPGPRIVLTAGEPLEVKCEAFGEPEPEVEWLHDPGPERGDLPDDFKPVTISEQFIRHPNIGIGNAGIYTCKGSNIQASATKDIYVEVVEASRIATVAILGGSTQWFDPDEAAELVCASTGSSLVDRLQWARLDGTMSPDTDDQNEPGILHFAQFKASDSGEYECRGYRGDELIATAKVQIYPINAGPLDAIHVEIDEPTIRVVRQGEPIVLSCSVLGRHNNGLNYEWGLLRGGSLVRQLPQGNVLTIKNADPSNDYGVYRCEVEDEDGELLGTAYTAVTIGYANHSSAQIVKFDDKAEANIICPLYAVPGAEITWEKQDGDLPDDSYPSRNKFIIKEFNDETAGLYICKMDVEGREIEGYVRAQIYVPDTIIQVLLESSSESITIGDRAWFDCKVTGDPEAEITWTKEGEDLPDNAQVTGNRLLFTNVQEDNGGIYKCHAKTKAGPLETRTVLNVGSAKRKRKHLPNKPRHFKIEKKAINKKHKIFGDWFNSNSSPSRKIFGAPLSPSTFKTFRSS